MVYDVLVEERSSCIIHILRSGVVVECTYIGTKLLYNVNVQERSSCTMYMFRTAVVVQCTCLGMEIFYIVPCLGTEL